MRNLLTAFGYMMFFAAVLAGYAANHDANLGPLDRPIAIVE
jgi:hypothetical protein